MVNFNFGLGGLGGGTKDDSKKDDSTVTTANDDTNNQDVVAATDMSQGDTSQGDTSDQGAAANDILLESAQAPTASEPVFEEEVTIADGETSSSADVVAQSPAFSTLESEESWLKDETTPTTNSEDESLLLNSDNQEPVVNNLDNPIATESQQENPFPEAALPIIEENKTTEVVESVMPAMPMAENSTSEMPMFGQPEETSTAEVPVVSTAKELVTPEVTIPAFAPLTVEPTDALIRENTDTAALETISSPVTIPTFAPLAEESKDILAEKNLDAAMPQEANPAIKEAALTSVATESVDVLTKESTDTASPDLLNPEVTVPDSSSNDLFQITNSEAVSDEDFLATPAGEETPIIENDELDSEDPLAPAALATIGHSAEPIKEALAASPLFGDTTKSDDNVQTDDSAQDANDPVETLQELKNGITQFVKNHNSKIDLYKKEIAELNKKIKAEKDILKDKQTKSSKILEDLATLVANFSTTNSIKKKRIKKTQKTK